MWSFFSRDPAKDFAYEVGEEVPGLEGKSIWTLHSGKHKTTGQEVSIFSFDVKGASDTQVQIARTSLKKIKTLRHPNILPYVDGLESEKVLYIATEKVVPLENYLRDNKEKTAQNELAISWGLHQMTKGLSFLINDCNLIHNNVCLWSVFVDKAGEWKLGGVDYMYPASGPESIPPVKILPPLEKYDPPEKKGYGQSKKPTEKWSADMWGLGCLIWEVFNGSLPDIASLKSLGKMPKSLVPNYCELVGANPKSRPNPSKFLESCRSPKSFMDNQLVKSMLFIEEIQIKEHSEKITFFNNLPPVLDSFPQEICRYKILPHLVHAFEFGNVGSAVLAPLFKLGKLLDTEEYQEKIVPCVVKLFSSPDRATRVKLLQQMEYFVEHLQPPVVNDKVFPHVVQGFMDTNPVVREQTIKEGNAGTFKMASTLMSLQIFNFPGQKFEDPVNILFSVLQKYCASMLHLAPKLNYKNLHDDLLKHLARLQTKDDQGGIRTNTTVCLGKIAGHINPQMRQKVLTSAYLRAVKDPFPPARQAAILAMAATHMYFTLSDSAARILPCLCTLTVDPEKGVRDQAFKAIKCYLSKLEKCSESPELQADMEKDVMAGSTSSAASAAASWTGWAVSGALGGVSSLTSKIYKGKSGANTAAGNSNSDKPKSPTESTASALATSLTSHKAPVAPSTPSEPEPEPEDPEMAADGVGGGWDDDGWDNDEDWGTMDQSAQEQDTQEEDATGDGWDDEDWGSLEEPTKPSSNTQKDSQSPWGTSDFSPVDGTSSTSAYNWDQEPNTGDAFFTSMINDSKKSGTSMGARKTTAGRTSTSSTAATAKSSRPSSAHSSSAGGGSSRASSMEPSGGDGWDESGWGNDNAWSADDGLSKADIAKQKREERKAQRQKELEQKKAARQASGGGGALKLGAKKMAKD